MKRSQAIPYVSYVVDNSLNGRKLNSDPTAIVYPHSVLVGWQCGFEPLFVSVHSYLGGDLEEQEAIELATDYLQEIGWFFDNENPPEPDYVISP